MKPLIRSLVGLTLILVFILSLSVPATSQEAAQTPRSVRIHQDLREILSRPEFSSAPEKESLIQIMGRWLRERWEAFMKWWNRLFSFGGRAGPGTARVVMWAVLAAMIVAIAYVLAYGLRRLGLRSGTARSLTGILSSDVLEEQIEDPDTLAAAAQELAAAGHLRRAYRAIFLAILLRLDKKGLIRFDRSRTNGEYLRSLRSRPEVFAWMRPLTNEFDVRWYGERSVDEQDFRRALRAYEGLNSSNQPS